MTRDTTKSETATAKGPLFFTPKETSKELGRSIDVLRGWRARKYGPRFTQLTSRTVLYYRADVTKWKAKLSGD